HRIWGFPRQREQPAPLMIPLQSLPYPQAALDRHVVHAEGPASSKLCPPARGQRMTSLRAIAATTHYCYCYPGADTERYATAIALETLRSHRDSSYPEPVRVHHAGHPPMTLEHRLLELK
ncbi:hypothetical protein THAOC_08360, partial [Thalassiosira oceanica]